MKNGEIIMVQEKVILSKPLLKEMIKKIEIIRNIIDYENELDIFILINEYCEELYQKSELILEAFRCLNYNSGHLKKDCGKINRCKYCEYNKDFEHDDYKDIIENENK